MTPDSYQTRRYVLRYPAGENEVSEFAQEMGWVRTTEIAHDLATGTSRQIVWQALDVASIHYLEDVIFQRGYYVLMGPEPRIVDALAKTAADSLGPWTVEELVEIADAAEDLLARGSAAILLSLAAPPEFDERVSSIITSLLLDEDSKGRSAALWMALFTKYREFLPVIEKIAAGDPLDWVRDRAVDVLGRYEEVDSP